VEVVEALTIVVAVDVVRGWRSALLGTAAALAVLVGLVAVLGPSLSRIPLLMVRNRSLAHCCSCFCSEHSRWSRSV
jgi:uncharacterized membrane protein